MESLFISETLQESFFYCLSLLLVGGGEVVWCVLAVRTHRVDVAVLKLKVLVFDYYEIDF